MIWAFDGFIGGVGKSTAAVTCGEALAADGKPFAVIECDGGNNVGSYFQKVATKVERIKMDSGAGWFDLVSALAEESTPDIVVSLPAGTNTAGNAPILLRAVNDVKKQMAIVWMMNRTPEAVAKFKQMIGAFGAVGPIRLVAARNTFFGEPEKFKIWAASETRKAFLAARGLEIDFPELNDTIMESTFGANPKVRFSSVESLRYGYRYEARRWLEETAGLYRSIAGIVEPEGSVRA